MAKGKHAAALFEVIHADRRFGKKTPPSRALSTPKWWFKGKRSADAPTPVAAAVPAGAPVSLASSLGSEPEPLDYMPSIPTERPVDVKVNPDRQEINFKLTYTSAIVGGFALLVVLSLAYIIGRKMNAGPSSAIAATVSTSDLRKKAPQTGVLELAKARNRETVSSVVPDADESAHIVDPEATKRPPAPPPLVNTAPPQPFNGKRLINQNYVVIQSWPAQEKAQADEAAKLLNEAGVGATVVQGLAGWQSTWYSVVGTLPFERTKNNPVYDAYVQKIMDVSTKYAGKTKWKRFEPMAKKWQGDA